MIELNRDQLRSTTILLAVGTILAGVLPILAPGWFARLFGLPWSERPGAEITIRSVGARDAVSGVGLLSAELHGGRVAPWLLGRLLSDASDVVWVSLAFLRGARSPRVVGLGAIALGAALLDLTLYRGHKALVGGGDGSD